MVADTLSSRPSIYLVAAHPHWRDSRVTRRLFEATRGATERIVIVFTETVPLVPSAAPPSVVTHNPRNTLCSAR